MKIFEHITDFFIPGREEPLRRFRGRIGKFQGWLSVIVNSVLFLIKIAIGLIINSVAMIADAFHTFADVISSAIVVWGFNEAEKPADTEHPFGHGRVEYIATLIIAILLCVAGVEFFKASLDAIRNPHPINPAWWMILVVILTMVVKEITARYAEFLSSKIASRTLYADAWHHRIDALSSLLVVVAFILARFGVNNVDGWAGMGVSVFIVWTGFEIAKDAVDDLIGKPPTASEIEEIRLLALKIEGVLGVHDIAIHSYGTDKFVSIHIEIDSECSPSQAHDIAEAVEESLKETLHISPTVHIDPIKMSHPVVKQVRDYMEQHWSRDERIQSFHDIRVVDTENPQVILFGLQVDPTLTRQRVKSCCNELEEDVKKAFPDYDINIKISGKHLF
ncbi:MAG: cation diffusion facilitator family transporter [Fidelibacterota bacterium]